MERQAAIVHEFFIPVVYVDTSNGDIRWGSLGRGDVVNVVV